MNFSVIVPTRKRIVRLIGLLNSLERKTRDRKNLEILIAYDSDDEQTKGFKELIIKTFKGLNIRFNEFIRLDNLHTYYNLLYRISGGKTLVTLNDDSEFMTQDWDEIAQKKIDEYTKKYPDGVYYCLTEDFLLKRQIGFYCCFPFVSRKFVDVIGSLQNEDFKWGGADIYLGNLAKSIDRIIELKEVAIDHISFHNYAHIEKDELYKENMERIKILNQRATDDIARDRDRLRKYIEGYYEKTKQIS